MESRCVDTDTYKPHSLGECNIDKFCYNMLAVQEGASENILNEVQQSTCQHYTPPEEIDENSENVENVESEGNMWIYILMGLGIVGIIFFIAILLIWK
jgi:ABC-type siderophore export system fused ATPase/permease subunit